MSLDVVIGLVGVTVTILVVVGMILITPHGVETSHLHSQSVAETPGVDDVAPPTPVATSPHGLDLNGPAQPVGHGLAPTDTA
jgi:hypothetical protein